MSWMAWRKTNDLLKSEQPIGLVCGSEQKITSVTSVTVLYTFVETVRDFVCLSVFIRLSIQRNRCLSVVLCTVVDSARYSLWSVAPSVGMLIPEPERPYVTLLIVVVVVVVVTVVRRRSGIDCWVRVHGTPMLDGCLTGRRRRCTVQDALPGKWRSYCLFSSACVAVSVCPSWTRTRWGILQYLPRDSWLSCLQHSVEFPSPILCTSQNPHTNWYRVASVQTFRICWILMVISEVLYFYLHLCRSRVGLVVRAANHCLPRC